MKIRTQFVITMILFIAVLLIVAAAVFVANRQVEHLNTQAEIVHRIERDASDLSYLSNDYLLFRESQQRTRWERKFSSFSAGLSAFHPDSAEQQTIVDNIHRSRQRLQAVFADVAATPAGRSQLQDAAAVQAVIQVSWSRMAVQNQGIIFEAQRLEQLVRSRIDQLKRKRDIFISALLVIFSAYFLANFLIVFRRILKSISYLRTGTKIIGSGNLDHVLQVQNTDEIGELSHAFNRMAADLKTVTASKADLEREIIERRKAQALLHEAAERLRIVADFPYDWEYWRSQDNRFLYVSPSCERITGYTREEFIQDPGLLSRIVHPDDRERVSTHMREDLFQSEACELEFRITQRNGMERWIGHVCQPVVNAQGQSIGRRASNRDITDRKRAESALSQSEKRFRHLFEAMSEGFALHEIICDDGGRPCDYRFLDVNPAFERHTGLKSENLIGRTFADVFPNDEPYWIERYGQVALTGHPAYFEHWSKFLKRCFDVSAFQTEPGRFAVIFQDITARKAAEQQLKRENREMALLNRILRAFTESAESELFDQVLDIVREGLSSRHGVFGYISEPGHLICPSLTKMLDECEIEGKCIHYPPEKWKGLWARALREKRSFYINKPQPVPAGHPAIHNNLAAPILFRGEAIGLLNLANKDGDYTETDRLLLETMTARIAPLLYAWIQKKLREDERVRAEEAVRQQREWLQVTLSSIGDAVIAADTAGRVTFINPIAAGLTGWALEEAMGRPIQSIVQTINEQTGEPGEDIVTCVLTEGCIVHMSNHTALINRRGDPIPIEDSAAPIKDGAGNVIGAVLVFRDVTAKRQAHKRLLESEETYRSIARNFPNGAVYLFDRDLRIHVADGQGLALIGLSREALEGKSVCEHPLYGQIEPSLQRVFNGESFATEIEYQGRIRHAQFLPIRSEQGEMIFAMIVVQDVTERRAVEAKLLQREQLYRELVQNANSAIIRWKNDGTIVFFNEYAQEFFGYGAEELIGRQVDIILPKAESSGADPQSLIKDIVDYPERYIHNINENICRGGRRVWMSWTNKPIRDENGNVAEILAIGSDFTQIKAAEEALRRSSEKFRLLSDSAARLLAAEDPQGIVEDLCRNVMPYLECQAFFNFLVDAETGRLRLNASAGIPEQEVRKIEWQDYGAAVNECMAWSGERIVAENIDRISDPRTEWVAAYGIRAYACHPLIIQGRVIGTLSFGTRTRGSFPPEDLDLMKTVADLVATAMDRKRILLELQRSRDELETRVQERTAELEKRARQLAHLASELTLVEERERRRLAGILHDNLQQLLVAVKMNIEVLTGSMGTAQRPTLEHILDLMKQSIKVSRSLTEELSPPLLQNYGLSASLKWLGRWMQEVHGLTVDLSVDPALDPKQEDHTMLLFQSVRELLFNVVKHAGVKSARVVMHRDEKGRRRIIVSDHGIGLDAKIIWDNANTGTGLGLFSIRERMMLMGGLLEVESEPGKGTSFSLVLPPQHNG